MPASVGCDGRKPRCGEELQYVAVHSGPWIGTFLPQTPSLAFIPSIHRTRLAPVPFPHKHLGNVDTSVSNAAAKACGI